MVSDTNTEPAGGGTPPADPDRFWALIAESRRDDIDDQTQALSQVLFALDQGTLVAFEADYLRLHRDAYRWDLWGAFYVINGGCSDDGFHYACDWLIAQGRAAYEAALADPESLIKHLKTDEDAWAEPFGYVAREVFEHKFDKDMPDLGFPPTGDPKGESWDEDDLEGRFPKLTAWDKARA